MVIAYLTGCHLAQMLKALCQQPHLPPLRSTLPQGLLPGGTTLAGRMTLKRHSHTPPLQKFP